MRPDRIFFQAVVLFVLLLPLYPGVPDARSAELADVAVTNTGDALLLSIRIKGAFGEEIKKAVYSGAPTTFSYYISLKRMRKLWTNKTLADLTLTHTIKYNNLKNEFTIRRSWRPDAPVTVKSFDEAQRLMSEIKDFKVAPLSDLRPGNRYQVGVKAKLSQIALPFYLEYLLMLGSEWEFETRWHFIDVEF